MYTLHSSPISAAAVALPDGRTLVAGGLANGTPTAAVVVFDPADSAFATAGQLLEPRAGHTATLLEDGRVLIAGGTVNELLSGDLEIFVLMSNAGLPEAGDMVLTFEPPVLADPARYAAAAVLSPPSLESAASRREKAMAGFLRLRAGGSTTWVAQYRVGPKQRRVTLGRLATLDPDQARRAARAVLAKADLGQDDQAECRERQGRDVVAERPEQVLLDGAQRRAGQADGVRGRP